MEPLGQVDFSFLRNSWAEVEPEWPSYRIRAEWNRGFIYCLETETPVVFRRGDSQFGKRYPSLVGECAGKRLQIDVLFSRTLNIGRREVRTELFDQDGEVLARGQWNRSMPNDVMEFSLGGQEFQIRAIAARTFLVQGDIPLMFVRSAWRDSEREDRVALFLHSQVDCRRSEHPLLAFMCIERALWRIQNHDNLTQEVRGE